MTILAFPIIFVLNVGLFIAAIEGLLGDLGLELFICFGLLFRQGVLLPLFVLLVSDAGSFTIAMGWITVVPYITLVSGRLCFLRGSFNCHTFTLSPTCPGLILSLCLAVSRRLFSLTLIRGFIRGNFPSRLDYIMIDRCMLVHHLFIHFI